MARNFQVLSIGYDRALMATRSMLLRNSGYTVEEAFSRHQAMILARSDLIDVLLICHTVPEMEKLALVSAVRRQRLLMPILCISDSDYLAPSTDGYKVVANAPAELLAGVDCVLRETPEIG
ncbi:MAG TPA: hypothetical protein VI685_25565 [Candidatus Angelobacter sp.]